jgi:hypothetical protein
LSENNFLIQGVIDGEVVRVALVPVHRLPNSSSAPTSTFILSNLRKTDTYRGKGSFKHPQVIPAEMKRAKWSNMKSKQNELLVELQLLDQRLSSDITVIEKLY